MTVCFTCTIVVRIKVFDRIGLYGTIFGKYFRMQKAERFSVLRYKNIICLAVHTPLFGLRTLYL